MSSLILCLILSYRIMFVGAREGVMPKLFSMISIRRLTPSPAIIALVSKRLRILTGCFRLVGSAMFGVTFNLVARVSLITIIFGTPKIASLEISSLPSNNCFSHRNVLQKMASTLCQKMNAFKRTRFLSKSSNFVHFRPNDFVQISPACSPNTLDLQC